MSRGFQGALMRGFGARDHVATVTGTQWLAPHFLRLRLTSPTLFDDIEVETTTWLRFWFPDPDGGETEYQRAYTLTEADPDTGAFAVDFVLHTPAGPACLWAERAQPGDTVPVMTSLTAGFTVPEELPAGFLLVGDAASIPAINSVLGALPAQVPVELYLERHSAHDEAIPLGGHPRLRVHWTDRRDAGSLAASIAASDWSDWYAWAAPESGSLKALQTRLRDEFGFPKREIHARAYWIEGRSMGKVRGNTAETSPATTDAAVAGTPNAPVATPVTTVEQQAVPAPEVPAAEPAAPSTPGRWRSQAAGTLLAPLKSRLIVAGVLQALVTLLELAPYLLLVELARRLLAGDGPDALWPLAVGAVVLLGAGALLGAGLLLWLHVVDARFARDLRLKLLDKLSRLPLGWFADRGSTGVKSLVSDDTLALHYLVTHAICDAVAAAVAPLAVLGYLFVADWRLGLVLLLPVLTYLVTMWIMVVQSGAKIGAAQRWAERMSGAASGYLDGQPVVRVFGGAAASAFTRRLEGYLRFLNEWQRPFTGKKTMMDLVTRPGTLSWLIAAAGTLMVIGGGLDVVGLLPFLLLGTAFGTRLLGIGYGLSGLRGGLIAARRIGIALTERELDTRPSASPDAVRPACGTVEFDRVSFGYHPGVPVIREVSAVLRPGTVTALVGPSGSGKSTLAALVARFHDVDSGAIRIDGDDLRTLDADELYRRVGFVLQDVALVHGTVAENIALARPDASREQIESAARDAQIHDRVLRLPQGYDTVLGDEVALSGGEKQRLTIARALLADTPVLVLDEATAFADPESEYLVQIALDRLTADRTVLVIAHRLHTIAGADTILVLDAGAVVESGSHDELLALDGRYRSLWQAGGNPLAEDRMEVRA
ncbi:MAG: ATP-binding cassette domain-containing protein [Micropruina sp.]|uniref:ABC transporter ATP-binding protein/permease n=1 Tax=Micropruina sp. TaxID=2737536 RepID=UPI0039E44DF4